MRPEKELAGTLRSTLQPDLWPMRGLGAVLPVILPSLVPLKMKSVEKMPGNWSRQAVLPSLKVHAENQSDSP